MRALCGHELSSWKVKPEPTVTAPIQKEIVTGFYEVVTQIHRQTRWPSTATGIISVLSFFRATLPMKHNL